LTFARAAFTAFFWFCVRRLSWLDLIAAHVRGFARQ